MKKKIPNILTPMIAALLLLLTENLIAQNLVTNGDFEYVKKDVLDPSSHMAHNAFKYQKQANFESYLSTIVDNWHNVNFACPYIIDASKGLAPQRQGYKLDVIAQSGKMMLGFNVHPLKKGGLFIFQKLKKEVCKGDILQLSCYKSNSVYSEFTSEELFYKFTNSPRAFILNNSNRNKGNLMLCLENEFELKKWNKYQSNIAVDSCYAYLVLGSFHSGKNFKKSTTKLPEKYLVPTALYYLDDIVLEKVDFHDEEVIEKQKENIEIKNYSVKDISFDLDNFSLKKESKRLIVEIFEEINDLKIYKMEIIGHTSADGEEAYNLDLSIKRATSVANYFNSLGIKKEIIVKGLGETQLLNSFNPEAKENRRVEIEIKFKKK